MVTKHQSLFAVCGPTPYSWDDLITFGTAHLIIIHKIVEKMSSLDLYSLIIYGSHKETEKTCRHLVLLYIQIEFAKPLRNA